MAKKILIIGNSAKAYSLAKKLAEKHEIYVAPSSDTLKEFATTLDIRENDSKGLLDFVLENEIDLTIPCSRASLLSDLTEVFSSNNQPVFAPSTGASSIIFDKALAK